MDNESDDPCNMETQTDDDDESAVGRANYLAELLPDTISRDRAKLVMQRAIDLRNKLKQSKVYKYKS